MNEDQTKTPTYQHLFGVYALIESSCGQKILLIERKNGPYKGLLDLPGGKPEPQEILEQTLCRTVAQELKLDVEHCQQYKTLSSLYQFCESGNAYVLRHIGVLYRTTPHREAIRIGEYHNEEDFKWYEKHDISNQDVTPFVSLYLGQ